MYETFYSLKSSPFRLSPDPNFFFGSQGHNRALSYLRYGLNQKEGFIVVTGNPGTGKTTLARALLKELGREKIVVAELNSTQLEADDVLRMVAATFGIEQENQAKATLLKKLEAFFIAKYRGGYHCLIMIDEAQNLPKRSLEELRMLFNFYVSNHALVQIFLLGQQQFRDVLNSPELEQLRQRVVAACHLEPLNELETRDYIEHRLKCVGWQNNPAITDEAFAAIARLSQGIPRRINTFCDRLFLYASLEELQTIDDKAVHTVGRELMYEVTLKNASGDSVESPVHNDDQSSHAKILNSTYTSVDSESKTESDSVQTQSAEKRVETTSRNPEPEKKQGEALSTVATNTSVNVPTPSVPKNSESTGFTVTVEEKPVKKTDDQITKKVVKTPLRVVSSNVQQQVASAEPEQQPVSETVVEPKVDNNQQDRDWLELVAIAWDYYQHPSGQHQVTNANVPLHPAISDLIKVAVGRLIVPSQFLESRLNGVSQDDIKRAAKFYIKEVLLCSRADYYRRLGLTIGASLEQIKSHYRYLFRLFQPDQEIVSEQWDETYTRRINQAYGVLRDAEKRRKYDAFLQGTEQSELNDDFTSSHTEILEASQQFQDVFSDKAQSDKTAQIAGMPKIKKKVSLVVIIASVLMIAGILGYMFFTGKLSSSHVQKSVTKLDNSAVIQKSDAFSTAISEIAVQEQSSAMQDAMQSTPGEQEVVSTAPVVDHEKTTDKAELSREKVDVSELGQADITEEKPKKKKKIAVDAEETVISKGSDAVTEAPVKKSKRNEKQQDAETSQKEKPAAKDAAVVAVPSVAVAPVVDATNNTAPVADTQITDDELDKLMQRFTFTYEEGDINLFMQLFSSDAATNDVSGKENIRRDYAELFKTTELRVIELKNMKWKKSGSSLAIGKGPFKVVVLRSGGSESREFNGDVEITVRKREGNLQVKSFFFSYAQNGG